MDVTTNTMSALVIKEATNIKRLATKEEVEKLNICFFAPANFNNCIYGQMTGDCNSPRAINLIQSCSELFYSVPFGLSAEKHLITTISLNRRRRGQFTNYSPIEFYIQTVDDKLSHKILIDFLQDKTKTLNLK